jgi:hypothetical protein
MIFALIGYTYNRESKIQQDKAIMRSATLGDLKKLPIKEPPIISAQDAISYAVNIESVRSNLEYRALKSNFVTWNITSQLTTASDTESWEVEILTTNILPPIGCFISFSIKGEIILNQGCIYLK